MKLIDIYGEKCKILLNPTDLRKVKNLSGVSGIDIILLINKDKIPDSYPKMLSGMLSGVSGIE